jgi:hypothetical protein
MGIGPIRDLRDSLYLLANNSFAGSQICAGQGHACNVSGQATVRFGAAGRYFHRTVSGSLACSADLWGDPIPGTWKACSQSPLVWIPCTGENGTCYFQGPKVVRFGANGAYNRRLASGAISCDRLTFGDPIQGTVKSCSYADPVWSHCANEGGTCAATPGQYVRYGSGVDWKYSTVSGSVACDNHFGDPTPGVPKVCEIASGF